VKIYWHNNKKNVVGERVRSLRKRLKITQKQLAEKLQLLGYEFDRLTILRIEAGDRFVADYEVRALSEALEINIDNLFEHNQIKTDD